MGIGITVSFLLLGSLPVSATERYPGPETLHLPVSLRIPKAGGQGVSLQLSGQGREPWTSGGQVGTKAGRQQADGLQVRNMGSLGARRGF